MQNGGPIYPRLSMIVKPRDVVTVQPAGRRVGVPLALLCFFFSGFAGLVLETVWARSLALHLGGSAAGVTAVVTAYMAGLGLGSLLVSLRAERFANPVRTYAFLEIAVALFAIGSTLILRAPEPLYRIAHDYEEVSWMIPFGFRFATSLLLLLVPTTAMGATLPLLVSALTRGGGSYPSRVAMLYGINTVGAVAGTLVAGFLLLPRFGATAALWVAAGVDLAVAVALLFAPTVGAVSGEPVGAADPAPAHAREARGKRGAGGRRRRLAMALFAVSGGLSMVYELGWTRRLITLWGSSTYSFTILLATFLAGLGVGSLLVKRPAERARHPIDALGAGFGLAGIAALAGTSLLAFIPAAFHRMLSSRTGSPAWIMAGEGLFAAAMLLPATLLLGAIFPLAARAARREGEDPGRAAGRVYAINTMGTVLGAAGAGLFLLPALGALTALRAAAFCHLLLGGALLLGYGADRRRILLAGGMVATFALLWTAAPPPDPYLLNYGVVKLLRDIRRGSGPPPSLEELEEGTPVHPVRMLSVEEGRTATVAVITSWHLRSLVINGKTDASNDDPTMVISGQLPMILADSPREVLVIGYGSGITTHSVLTHPVGRVETVEIEPAVVHAGRFFADLNGQDRPDNRSAIYYEDGRIHLTYSRKIYDVIISEPSNPWITGINNLFTSQFYKLVRRRLAPGGLFCQWLQTYELSRATLESLLATLREAFPGAEVYRQGADLLVVWKRDGAFLTRERAERAFASPQIRQDLQRVGFETPSDLLPLYLGPIEAVAPRKGPIRRNTDDNAYVEFHAPLDLLKGGDAEPCNVPPLSALDLRRWDPSLPVTAVLAPFARKPASFRYIGRSREVIAALEAAGAKEEASALRAQVDARETAQRAQPRFRALLDRSNDAFHARDYGRSESLLREAVALAPDDPDLLYSIGRLLMNTERFDLAEKALTEALDGYRRNLSLSESNKGNPYQTEVYLGILACQRGKFDEGLALFDRAEALNPYLSIAHYYRARAFEALGRKDEAKREVRVGLAIDPKDGLLAKMASEIGRPGR